MIVRSSLLAGLVLATPALAAPKSTAAPVVVAAAPPAPSVRAGVDLWRAGDWAGAVAIWQPFAAAGDPDAMFNLGQAYKLGRAVPVDKVVARDWYRKAATKGHLPAQANLGILLFQAGEKPEAARWLKTAADRGEMRAQYVLGVAHWNGDGVAKSLSLAYAYLSRASAQGLTEATAALGNLGRTISPAERSNGASIAASLASGGGVPATSAPAASPMTAAELNRMNLEAVQRPLPAAAPVPKPVVVPPPATAVDKPVSAPPPVVAPAPIPASPRPASPRPASVVPPVVATPVERPAAPMVQAVELPPTPPPLAAQPTPPSSAAQQTPPLPLPKPAPVVAKPVETPKPADKPKIAEKPKADVTPPGWRVQLGAFGKRAQAEAAWADVVAKQKAAVGKAKPIYDPGTSIIKLQMGPYKTRELAKDACAKLAFSGRACFVVAG